MDTGEEEKPEVRRGRSKEKQTNREKRDHAPKPSKSSEPLASLELPGKR